MVFRRIPDACFHEVVVTTMNYRNLPNGLPSRTHANGERTVLISNCEVFLEHCEVSNRFRIVGLNEHDSNGESNVSFFYFTLETVTERIDTRSSTGAHLGGRTTVQARVGSDSSIIFQMKRPDNYAFNEALATVREFLLSLQQQAP
jgi:hypothetical protein